MFELCAQRLRELYEYDPHVYHLDLLQHLATKAFLEWTQRGFRLSEDEDYQLPAYQLRLSDHLGFDTKTPYLEPTDPRLYGSTAKCFSYFIFPPFDRVS